MRKIKATNEIYHWLAGTIDTPEKFEKERLNMAKRVWKSMRDSDSLECRNSHINEAMTKKNQTKPAWRRHRDASKKGETCIDCHKGIVHKDISDLYDEEAGEEQ